LLKSAISCLAPYLIGSFCFSLVWHIRTKTMRNSNSDLDCQTWPDSPERVTGQSPRKRINRATLFASHNPS
jgi:hypothetical protein